MSHFSCLPQANSPHLSGENTLQKSCPWEGLPSLLSFKAGPEGSSDATAVPYCEIPEYCTEPPANQAPFVLCSQQVIGRSPRARRCVLRVGGSRTGVGVLKVTQMQQACVFRPCLTQPQIYCFHLVVWWCWVHFSWFTGHIIHGS